MKLTLLAIGWLFLTGCTPPGPRALLEGERLIGAGKYGDALEPLRKATLLLPNNAQAWNHLGLASHRAGLPREADEAYRKALALNPNLAAARFNLGCLWLELNGPAEAALHLGSYVMLDPKNLEARILLGAALLRANRTDDAEKTYKEVLAVNDGLSEALNGLALAQVQRKRTRDAAATLYTAIQVKPDYQPTLLNLAIVNHQYLNNKPLALQYYRNYLTLSPKPVFFEPVTIIARQLEAELNKAPSPPTSNVTNPATGLLPPGNLTRTNATVLPVNQSITAKAPTNLPLTVQTGGVERPPLAERPPEATAGQTPRYKYLHPAKPAAGDRAKAANLFLLGQKAQQDNRLAEAIVNFEAAGKVDPAFFEAYARLGRAALDAGDKVKALTAYEYALALNPDASGPRFNFALALHQAGYLLDAAEELERFFQQNPKDTNGRLFLANLYAQNLKQPGKAREHYQKLLEMEPQHPQANAIRQWLVEHP